MRYKNNLSLGFTLVETLVATAMFVVVITVVIVTFGFSSSLQSKNTALTEASQNVRFIIEAIARDIRLADSFIISADGKSITLVKNNQTIEYFLQDNNIYYSDEYSIDYPLNSGDITVDNLEFQGIDDTVEKNQSYLEIEIDFAANSGSTKKVETSSQTIETTVSTRAYNKGFDEKVTQ